MNKKITIAIDGWSSCGKSTLAKQLAKELSYVYIDSGAMYRAITLYFLRNHIDWTSEEEVNAALNDITLEFKPNNKTGESEIYLNEENVEYVIRDLVVAEKVSEVAALNDITLEFKTNNKTGDSEIYLNEENVEYVIRDLVVAEKVSEVAAIKAVRSFAVAQQQKMGAEKGIIMDGRDIGTTVFPNAELKIFMTADNAIRVERRFKELYEKNPNITIEEVKANLEMRDYIDSHREVSPLQKAADAVVIDNSDITPGEQLHLALKYVRMK